ncbi:LuxR C-terminal-related transcriptional regulator [Nakamurella sp.]|uniref:LuxR C-terminal-related transcriptional regulator n=1 Tax=Nakamurella sp. TaxID=1869182 RepID=UPI0037844E85
MRAGEIDNVDLGASRASASRQAAITQVSEPPGERDVLDRIAAGEANAVIADRLGLSEKTVRNNVSATLGKLLVADRAPAIVKARNAGFGSP